MAIIVPKQAYIGFQERLTGDWNAPRDEKERIILGFMTYYEENKAFEQRKGTIDSWAKPYYLEQIHEGDSRWSEHLEKFERGRIEVPLPDLEAKIMDNPLQSGFKMSREVKRTSSWNGGNVVWRIEDPRGFELEIQSGNMAKIMEYCIIDHGEIQGKCVWAWDKSKGSRLVLLPENSEPYLEAMKDTKRIHKKVGLRDVSIGDRIELQNGIVGKYLGSHFCLFHVDNYYEESLMGDAGMTEFRPYSYGHKWPIENIKKRHFIQLDSEALFIRAQPKVSTILDKSDKKLTKKDGEDLINTELNKGFKTVDEDPEKAHHYLFDKKIVFVSNKKITEDTYQLKLIPTDINNMYQTALVDKDIKVKRTETSVLTRDDKGLWLVDILQHKWQEPFRFESGVLTGKLISEDYLAKDIILTMRKKVKLLERRVGGYADITRDFEIDNTNWGTFVIEYNGEQYLSRM